MKRLLKLVLPIVLIVSIMMNLCITASAFDFEWDMEVGEELSLGLSETPYVSDDTSVIEVKHEGGYKYTAVAVGKGNATVTGGTWMGAKQDDYKFTVYSSPFDRFVSRCWWIFIIIGVVLIFIISSAVYIFITAPKYSMSRWWAITPFFINIFGLILFIAVKSTNKPTSPKYTVTCPVCNGVHPIGTTVCPICGKNLQ